MKTALGVTVLSNLPRSLRCKLDASNRKNVRRRENAEDWVRGEVQKVPDISLRDWRVLRVL